MSSCFLFCLVFFLSCNAQKKDNSARLYDLGRPEVIELPKAIDEISGISWDARNGSVLAIDDNEGKLFRISLQQPPRVEEWEVGKPKDYEDVVLHEGKVYILQSAGSVLYFPFSMPVSDPREASLDIGGNNEFEILYKTSGRNTLTMICKGCKSDGKDAVTAYAFDLSAGRFLTQPSGSLEVAKIEERLGKKVGRFKPSAANVHPATGDVYIVSSINQLLVVAGADFSVKEVYELDRKTFKQPEGLCFSPNGDLLISNEAAGKGAANILRFKQKGRN